MRPGTRVEVRSTFDGSWVGGFEIVDVEDDEGYRLKRLSDGDILPTVFPADAIRRAARRETWWVQ